MKQILKKIGIMLLIFCIVFQSMGICVFGDEIDVELTDEELIESGLLTDPAAGDDETEQPENSEVDIDELPEDNEDDAPTDKQEDEESEEVIPQVVGYSKSDNKRINLLSALGIIRALPEADALITRQQFAESLYRLLNLKVESGGGSVTYFYDIDLDNPALESINALYTIGIMNGTSERIFSPKENMSYINALVAIVRTLGYDIAAQKSGGYPSGYLNIASKIDLYGSGANEAGLLTGKALVNLFYTALFANVMGVESFSTTSIEYSTSGTSLLKSNFGYSKNTGRVVADAFASIGGRATCDVDNVVIKIGQNDYIYTLISNDGADYIGRNVEFYSNDAGEIVHMVEKENTHELVIDGYDIVSVDPYIREIRYKAGNSVRTARIENMADFVYNGVNEIPSPADIENSNGSIRLLDGDMDGSYDCVLVTNYQYYFVDTVTSGGILRDIRFNTYFDFRTDDNDYVTKVIKYGVEIPVGMISSSELVAIVESRNLSGKKKITAYVYDDIVQGTVTGIGDSVIEVDGKAYEYVKGFSHDLLFLGDNALFGLNENGRICFFSKNFFNKRTYLYVVGFARSFSNACEIRAMNEAGDFEVYDFAKSFRVNNVKGTPENLQSNLYAGGGSLKPQLVAVEFDEEMKIKKIEIDYTPEGPRNLLNKDVFTFNKSTTDSRLDINRSVIGAEYWLGADTRRFVIFTDTRGNIMEEMSSAGTSKFIIPKSRMMVPMDIYDASEDDRIAGAIVLKIAVDSLESYYGYETNTFIVEKMFYQRNIDEDFVLAASGYINGSKVVLMGEPGVYDLTGWNPGDIYSIMRSSSGNVLKAVKRFALTEDAGDTSAIYYDKAYTAEAPAVSSERIATTSALTFGNLRNVVTSPIRTAYIEVEGSGDVFTYSFTSSSRVYSYNVTTHECKSTMLEELVPGSGKAFVFSGYGQIYDLVVFEE